MMLTMVMVVVMMMMLLLLLLLLLLLMMMMIMTMMVTLQGCRAPGRAYSSGEKATSTASPPPSSTPTVATCT
jgi:hypothetical protein